MRSEHRRQRARKLSTLMLALLVSGISFWIFLAALHGYGGLGLMASTASAMAFSALVYLLICAVLWICDRLYEKTSPGKTPRFKLR